MLVQRIGTPLSVAGLLAIAALGFGVLTLVGGPRAAFTVALGWMLWALGGSAAATLTTDTLIGSAPPERAGGLRRWRRPAPSWAARWASPRSAAWGRRSIAGWWPRRYRKACRPSSPPPRATPSAAQAGFDGLHEGSPRCASGVG
jgi:hypothetical protein